MTNNLKESVKKLKLFDAVTIVAGSMIGSGIFIVSSDIAQQVNSSGLLLIVWLVAGILTILGALCYGEYAACWPQAGGQYVYLRKGWGELIGFLWGWTSFLVIQTGTIAAVAAAFAKFLGILFPAVNSTHYLINSHYFSASYQQIAAILLIILITGINLAGIKIGSIIQNIFTVTKVLSLAGLILCGVYWGLNSPDINLSNTLTLPAFDVSLLPIIAVAMVGALFSSDAWNNVTFIAGEIEKAEKNLPLALIIGTGSVILLYLLINMAYLVVLPFSAIQHPSEDIIGAAFMGSIFGSYGMKIISIIILISVIGCINGLILAGARVFYAMAKDGLFFKKLSKLGNKSGVPENSLILQGIWASILVMSGSYSQLLDYVIFAALIFYVMTIGGLFICRKKYPDIPRPYKIIGYPYIPLIYCIIASFIAINILISKPFYAWAGLFIVIAGIPVYIFWKKKDNINIESEIATEE
ncbi:MAG: amino acid permease [Candidatus Gastranaerophilales bacterium]|nr:amino acid permease [Candidatus Gastranaerophilales bacterium]